MAGVGSVGRMAIHLPEARLAELEAVRAVLVLVLMEETLPKMKKLKGPMDLRGLKNSKRKEVQEIGLAGALELNAELVPWVPFYLVPEHQQLWEGL